MPLAALVAAALFAIGAPWALLYAPADYQQGESVRIMYVHVPAAWWALGIYVAMGVASLMSLVWRHLLADVAARADTRAQLFEV
jgi:heme exporter protein C